MDAVTSALAALPITGPVLAALAVAVVVLWRRCDAIQAQRVQDIQQYTAQLTTLSRDVIQALGGVSNALGGVREATAEIKLLLREVGEDVDQIRRPARK